MDAIAQTLMNQLASGNNLSAISKSVGTSDQDAVKSALGMGIPAIMGSMANKASTPGGADMLTSMLSQVGGSNPADNLGSYLANPAAAGGSSMVNSLLGSQMSGIQTAISQKTGLPPAIIGKILAVVAPLVMGYVGKMFAGKQVDQAALTSLLGEQSKMAMQSSPEAAAMAKQLLAGKEEASGVSGMFRKLFKS